MAGGQPMGGTSHEFSCSLPVGGMLLVSHANVGDPLLGLGGVSHPMALVRLAGPLGWPMRGSLGAFSCAAFDTAGPPASSAARSSLVVHAYRFLHLAPSDFPPHPHPGVEPLCHPDPVEEVFIDLSPSCSRRGSSSSVASRLRSPPPHSHFQALFKA